MFYISQIVNIIDIESFINFYIVQELFKNIDFSAGNLNLDTCSYYCNKGCENTYEDGAAFNRNYQPIELGGSGWDVSKEYR